MINLKGRSFLTLLDFTPAEIQYLINLSLWIKRGKFAGNEERKLVGKSVCLLFQKDSTRTRAAFENAAGDQGAHTVYFGPTGSHFAKKESIEDSAKVLGQMFDGIQFRGFKQEDAEKLAKYSGVPVWNGLTDEYHPTQILADFLTILELRGSLRGKRLAFFGDAKNNMGNSLMIGAAKMGMHFVCVAPKKYWPEEKLIKKCKEIAKETDAQFTFTEDPKEGAKGSDVFYTDVWVSLGEPEEVWKKRIDDLQKYRVTLDLIKLGKPDAIFLHCLPAFHDLETDVGKAIYKKFGIKEMEVSDELFRSKYSHVFQQAGNRLHTIKAVVLSTIG